MIDFQIKVDPRILQAILPEIDEEFLLGIVKKEEAKLKGEEKLMNKMEKNPMRKAAKKRIKK